MAARTQRPAAIAVGDRVPKLVLPNRDGRPVSLRHRSIAAGVVVPVLPGAEGGRARYRARYRAGGAVVFSCALLHELHEVTSAGASACLPSSPATPRRSG